MTDIPSWDKAVADAKEAELRERIDGITRKPTKDELLDDAYRAMSRVEEQALILRNAEIARHMGLSRKESNAYIKSKFDELAERDRDLQRKGFKPQHGTRYWRDSSGTYIDPDTGKEVE